MNLFKKRDGAKILVTHKGYAKTNILEGWQHAAPNHSQFLCDAHHTTQCAQVLERRLASAALYKEGSH